MVVARYGELVRLGFCSTSIHKKEEFPEYLVYEQQTNKNELLCILMQHAGQDIYYGHAARDINGNSLSVHETDLERDILLDDAPLEQFLKDLKTGLKLEQKV